MASITKIEGGYRVQIKKLGIRDSKVLSTRRDAVEWGNRREAEITSNHHTPKGQLHSLRDALRQYAEDMSPTKRGKRWEQIRLAAFENYHLSPDKKIGAVTAQDIATFRDARAAKVGPASVIRELSLLLSVFETARLEWGWVESNPCKSIRKPSQVRHRERVIAWFEIKAMQRQMGYSKTARVSSVGHSSLCACRWLLRFALKVGPIHALI